LDLHYDLSLSHCTAASLSTNTRRLVYTLYFSYNHGQQSASASSKLRCTSSVLLEKLVLHNLAPAGSDAKLDVSRALDVPDLINITITITRSEHARLPCNGDVRTRKSDTIATMRLCSPNSLQALHERHRSVGDKSQLVGMTQANHAKLNSRHATRITERMSASCSSRFQHIARPRR
jgi:hypothetical protein